MADLRAQSHRELFFSDAFEEFTAELSSQLHRHCLARGAWSKLLTPWQSWLKTHGILWEEDELPAAILYGWNWLRPSSFDYITDGLADRENIKPVRVAEHFGG